MSAAAITSFPSTLPHSSKPLFDVNTVETRSSRTLINWMNGTVKLTDFLEVPLIDMPPVGCELLFGTDLALNWNSHPTRQACA